jgi:uncharacterized repeat protein (TIGR03803 family)
MKKLRFARITCIVTVFCLATAVASRAQKFTSFYSFGPDPGHGAYPATSTLVQGLDGNYYGATLFGGNFACPGYYGCGTLFKITPTGVLTYLYRFCSLTNCADGEFPNGGLTLGANGNFYGVTDQGGIHHWGTFFEITPEGKLTTRYTFCSTGHCSDGSGPYGALVQGTDGNFYGTTSSGGKYEVGISQGTVFKMTPTGALTTLYSFCAVTNSQGYCTDGSAPYSALLQASDGNFYGTTAEGGDYNLGTVFEITPAGTLTTLHSFDGNDGAEPYSALVEFDGNFYGMTYLGGTGGMGTVFEITPAGVVTTLHSFCPSRQPSCADGAYPYGTLFQAPDGNFYATTQLAGPRNQGTIFEITSAGALTTRYNFIDFNGYPVDGANPQAGLMQGTSGILYGTTYFGGNVDLDYDCSGDEGCGTIFALSAGFSPFVQANPNSGEVGGSVNILGNNLGKTTSVTFNGVPATFKAVSDSYITAQVPTGATTGTIQVVTPSGTLSSNVAFQVLP